MLPKPNIVILQCLVRAFNIVLLQYLVKAFNIVLLQYLVKAFNIVLLQYLVKTFNIVLLQCKSYYSGQEHVSYVFWMLCFAPRGDSTIIYAVLSRTIISVINSKEFLINIILLLTHKLDNFGTSHHDIL